MWLEAAGIGLLMMVVFWVALFLAARQLPPGRARELVGFGPNAIILIRRLRREHHLPLRSRLALGAALAYLVSPVQLIPNVIPVVGQTDDIVVLMVALRSACRHLPRSAVVASWPGDPRYLDRLLGSPAPVTPAEAPAVAGTVDLGTEP
jgi:uncharacterized membrane protein YkvA (DUF1232 family)